MTPPPAEPALHLLPQPTRVDRLAGECRLPIPTAYTGDPPISPEPAWRGVLRASESATPTVLISTSNSLPAEGYTLRIDQSLTPSVRIEASTELGARHALRTLAQLLRTHRDGPAATIPCIHIEDEPACPNRGIMLDVSRDRVPTMRHLHELVSLLASLKINHLQLYTEHTFAYAGHEEVWRGWSPLTPEEVLRLDGWCRSHQITLAANQNCFGHLSPWLRHPRYAHLAETHDEYDFYGIRRRGPFSLCPIDPRSAEFIDGLLAQLLPCFSSGLVNIGCDETADVGQGRSAAKVHERGYAPVYFDFLNRVADTVRSHRFRPMFWADIALHHPAHAHRIPEGAVALAWHYEPNAPFSEWCERLTSLGHETWACPGTSAWRSITGRTTERHANLAAAAEALRHGARGMLITEWGDLGHRQQWPITAHALAHAAHTAWTGNATTFDPRAAAIHALDDPTGRTGPWLEALGDADLHIRRRAGPPRPDGTRPALANASALFSEMHPARPDHGLPGTRAHWEEVEHRLETLRASLPEDAPPLVRDELRHTLDVAASAACLGVTRRSTQSDEQDRHAPRPDDLRGRLAGIMDDHRRLWLARSRPGGLGSSLAHYADLLP